LADKSSWEPVVFDSLRDAPIAYVPTEALADSAA
jgi:hypothetical protein